MPAVDLVVAALNRIDWDFPRAGNPLGSVHSLHRFPGNFISQIPSFLIQVLCEPGALVLDPFGGSGTTALEAIKLGHRVISADRLSISLLLSDGKVSASLRPLDPRTRQEVLMSLTWDHECHSNNPGLNGEGSDPRLSAWYAPGTLSQLRYIWSVVEKQLPEPRKILTLLFSELLLTCAKSRGAVTSSGKVRRPHWGWIADNVCPKNLVEQNVAHAFRSRLTSLPELPEVKATADRQVLLLQQDARCLAIAPETIDLIVTSPPYIGVIDHTRANRLLYTWMGWPFDQERTEEIGARFKRCRKNFVTEYLTDMAQCWSEFHRVLRPGAYCAVVIGESRKFPGTAQHALSDLSKLMPVVWGPIARTPSRRRVSGRRASASIEYIVVVKKA